MTAMTHATILNAARSVKQPAAAVAARTAVRADSMAAGTAGRPGTTLKKYMKNINALILFAHSFGGLSPPKFQA